MKKMILFLSICSFIAVTTAQDCEAHDTLRSGSCPFRSTRDLPLLECQDLCDDTAPIITPDQCGDYKHCCGNGTHCFQKVKPPPAGAVDNGKDAEESVQTALLGELTGTIAPRFLSVGPPNIIPGVPFPGCVPNVPSGGFPVSIAFPGYGGPGANPFGPSIPGPPVPPPPGNFYGGSNPFTPGFNPLLPPIGYPPVQLPNVCPQFPNNCKPNCRNPDFSPLVDVPYCQRIPCSPSDPLLDQDFAKCIRQPGCSFDYELFQYRRYLQHGVLAGVPVCHLTIRHPVFHRRAAEYVQQHGSWNPLLTKCLINEYREEIFGGSPGCYLVSMLEQFGQRAKSCGWRSIKESECYLSGCCWRTHPVFGPGCVSSVVPNQIKVRSGNDEQEESGFPSDRNLYGLPACLPFPSDATGPTFLDNYHICLKTGCAANVDINTYYQHLYQAGSGQLPFHLQQTYLDMIYGGQARPDNYQQVIKNILRSDPFSALTGGGGIPNLNPGTIPFSLPLDNDDDDDDSGSDPRFLNPGQPPSFPGFNPNPFPGAGPSGLSIFPPSPGAGFPNPYQPQCPFKPLNYPGLPPLKGKFDGCCDKPFCYIPRHQVRSSSSGITGYLSQWSKYGKCSVECGGGTQKRTRRCIGDGCEGRKPEVQTKVCNTKCCAKYRPWKPWQPCSQTRCGEGVQTRTRECYCGNNKVSNERCEGEDSETRTCSICACPTYQYTDWGTCDGDCCNGFHTRTRTCSNMGTCPQAASWCAPKVERESCPLFCDSWKLQASGSCNQQTCLSEPRCEADDGSPGNCCNPAEKGRGNRCCEGRCWVFCFGR
ncbi:unnamed protein product [Clavelina lepadiformis]|uniref:Uncharacterized protein n=1 Tax=Clavelina lepadiformis TaxID=159417 RepID=A0ABP0G7D6_CLALP